MSDYTITDVERFDAFPFTNSAGVSAVLTLSDGSVMCVSHVETDPAGVWGVDAAFKGNGYPLWSNGTGARYLSVKTVTDEIGAELDKAAAALA